MSRTFMSNPDSQEETRKFKTVSFPHCRLRRVNDAIMSLIWKLWIS
ncbi:MAG: hypothetical protein Ct9H90mP8_1740 [Pseudomonadota bacterium]|nr:MAG: hypothetical protein Ct9H90mP8_1740 [Pseudomonadota bacterium]